VREYGCSLMQIEKEMNLSHTTARDKHQSAGNCNRVRAELLTQIEMCT
jgi:hypothetical protein